MNSWVYELDCTQTKPLEAHFGGKACGLDLLIRAHIPTPRTWAISSNLYQKWQQADESALEFLEQHLGPFLDSLPHQLYAVRSSAVGEDSHSSSFAGMYDTSLNVPKDQLKIEIAKVWQGAGNVRAKAYDHHQLHPMGVILQPMVEAQYAGVCFAKHPSPRHLFDQDKMVVEYIQGAGEDVVSGKVTPDRLMLSEQELLKKGGWFTDIALAKQKLASYLNYEPDLEFVVDHQDQLWLVQQRPITTQIISNQLDLTRYDRRYKRALEMLDIELLIAGCHRYLSPFLELDIDLGAWMLMTTGNDGYQELWVEQDIDKAVVTCVREKIAKESSYLERLHRAYMERHSTLISHSYCHYSSDNFEEWISWMLPIEAHYYIPMFVLDALHAHLLELMQTIDFENAEKDLFALGTENIESLYERFESELRSNPKLTQSELERLCHLYGFIDCHQPGSKGYTPDKILEIQRQLKPKEKQEKTVNSSLWSKYEKIEGWASLMSAFRQWMSMRNQEMEYLLFAYHQSAPLFEDLAKSLGCEEEEVWSFSRKEILEGIQKKSMEVSSREDRAQKVILCREGVVGIYSDINVVREQSQARDLLRGSTVYGKGVLQGKVKIVFSADELKALEQEQDPVIIVTGMTSPDFIPYMGKNVLALVTDEGGILCHAAIVAREMGLPCIVGTSDATEQLTEGTIAQLNFDLATIEKKSVNP